MVNERKYNEPEKHCSPQRVWFRREMRNRCKPYVSTQFQPCRITKLWLDGVDAQQMARTEFFLLLCSY